ncbi:MAG: nitroreductase family protein [Deltaproteobacteria bacterium]|nr:nitroreductase family protein [Deltaproteobacteria bacterium]MBW1960584.1 nitroreductase family protein [Deltaproteobacteria bacterium]MBW1994668.1 nitroreductase family protein [Deltaproteobacteria bacterium]MBW2150887.1 nitroreductase family protein [Deltaproteobacteria bacterium]
MEFSELVKSRRSCRSFDETPIPEEHLQAILKAGQWAPSPLNLQPWEFIIITDPTIKTRIKEVAEEARQEVIDKNGPGWVKKYEMQFLQQAPVLVVVTVDLSKGGLGDFFGQRTGAIQAASACVQNMMLAASDQGFETLWFTFFQPEKLKSVLSIPKHLEIAAVIPMGKPREAAKAPPRKDPSVHREQYSK